MRAGAGDSRGVVRQLRGHQSGHQYGGVEHRCDQLDFHRGPLCPRGTELVGALRWLPGHGGHVALRSDESGREHDLGLSLLLRGHIHVHARGCDRVQVPGPPEMPGHAIPRRARPLVLGLAGSAWANRLGHGAVAHSAGSRNRGFRGGMRHFSEHRMADCSGADRCRPDGHGGLLLHSSVHGLGRPAAAEVRLAPGDARRLLDHSGLLRGLGRRRAGERHTAVSGARG
mmetsp:Transcript_21402/g.49821  ORF Transcript_21402/g.49821 Transcript_21402/m.49821 type:complete len:228 (+) Transcript_21402:300-983(+)